MSIIIILLLYMAVAHYISYHYLKNKILKSRIWNLNISCGKTDGGGINADIVKHKDLHNFVLVKDIYHLPFKNKQFNHVLCSHTIEHVDDPDKFYNELKRVGKNVVLVVPPLWDIYACLFTPDTHKWIPLTIRKKHNKLPIFIRHPLSKPIQSLFGQNIKT